jgi:hypothetical protein
MSNEKTDEQMADDYTILADQFLRDPDISDELAYQVARIATNTAKSLRQHGGPREGAGRPPAPDDENKRRPRTLFVSDAELPKIKAFIASLRAE